MPFLTIITSALNSSIIPKTYANGSLASEGELFYLLNIEGTAYYTNLGNIYTISNTDKVLYIKKNGITSPII